MFELNTDTDYSTPLTITRQELYGSKFYHIQTWKII